LKYLSARIVIKFRTGGPWQKFIHNSLQNLNLTSLDFDINKINQLLTDQHSKVILNKLQHLSTQEHNNKLFFFANIYPKDFILQDFE
jgi:hypothetical protein